MFDIIAYITNLIHGFGYLGIFVASFIETIFPPIPSELILPLAGFISFESKYGYLETFGMAFFGSIGSTIGGIIIYFISRKLGRFAVLKVGKYLFITEKKIEIAEKWFEKYGTYAVFFGRMAPGIREIISIPAGIAKMNILKFLLFTFFGSLVWSCLLVFSGYILGSSWEKLSESLSNFFPYVTVIIFLGLALYIFYYLFIKKKRNIVKTK